MSEGIDFLDLMRSFDRGQQDLPRIGNSGSRQQDIVFLAQEPHVDYSDANVRAVEKARDGKPVVRTRFLGLLGPQGALPLHTTYEVAHWSNMRDVAFSQFVDIFNNRFIQLFYRTWANARPAVQADRPNDNQFLTYLGATIGIGTPATQNRDTMHDFTKLAVAGLLAPAVKSASRLEGMLAWMFKVQVSVEQFTGVWLPLDKAEQAALSKGNCSLGVDSIIGKSTFSVRDKFRVKLKVATLAEFETFLPSGKNFRLMADAIEFYVGNMMMYDVAIGLPEQEAKPLQVGGFGRLGWTSWLTKKTSQDPQKTRWDCRFYPAELKQP